jgi:hypothetical protein
MAGVVEMMYEGLGSTEDQDVLSQPRSGKEVHSGLVEVEVH